jgi:3-oxoacyl-[acyl-carrier-protein] synthase-3
MRFSKVNIAAIGYELAPNVITSAAIEDRLAPVYERLKLPFGQLELLTGIRERRYWDPGQNMHEPAARAGAKALRKARVSPDDVGIVIYAAVCRDNLEPATACAVADALGVRGAAEVVDVSNACLGVLNAMVYAASAIELGRCRAALIVSCESARQIVDLTIERLLANPDMNAFRPAVATMTGGSGAIGVVLTEASLAPQGHRLLGGVIRSAPQHHNLCRWGPDTGIPSSAPMVMETDAAAVLEHGVALGVETWRAFLPEMGWETCDRIICHQVGAWHRDAVLKALGVPADRDFSTFPFLGNVGTVSLPITAAIAEERGFLERGQRVGLCGIGSGLNCLILGVEW